MAGIDRRSGPAVPPGPPRHGPLAAAVALARLPTDLVVALGYLVRELPHLVQDVRSTVNDVARLAQDGPLRELLGELAEAAGPDGDLRELLAAVRDLGAARAEVEAERSPGRPPVSRRGS